MEPRRRPTCCPRPHAAIALAGALAACTTAPAGFERPEQPLPTPEGLVDATDPQPISEVAWRYGPAPWKTDAVGDPRIEAEMGGLAYAIEFYGCDVGRGCTDLRFVTRATVMDAEAPDRPASRQALVWKANRWNLEHRFGKASAGEARGELILELNATLAGGVTRQNLDALFDWWRVALAEFRDFTEL
ncbi:YbjN domain-containing protein [Limibaculum sp. FT325]|uniref:YbjN domain-containing protein n=1 Tax=Thermohalobaculum sediminis TaxID=2939436 RepID=UPI0020C05818|nr:YbjN domain-containing protein [Limibaculum sediminis]MCL5775842.1 YbjN domain-containing protein [Limibaculum sediminis]